MKIVLALIVILSSPFAYAKATPGTADWVVEIGTLLVEGVAAKDLYQSLNAVEVIDPKSTNYDQYRTKENAFAKCGVSFYRVETQEDSEWVIQDNAQCEIKAPPGTVINQ